MTADEVLTCQKLTAAFLTTYETQLASDRRLFRNLAEARLLVEQVRIAAPYLWRPAMVRVVTETAQSFPLGNFSVQPATLHQPLMLWITEENFCTVSSSGESDATVPIVGFLVCLWKKGAAFGVTFPPGIDTLPPEDREAWVRSTSDGIIVRAFSGRSVRRADAENAKWMHCPYGRILLPIMTFTLGYGDGGGRLDGPPPAEDLPPGDTTYAIEVEEQRRIILAASALIRQRILVSSTLSLTRSEQRRLTSPPPTSLQVITLRATERTARSDEGRPVDWSHRWIVNGHWRRQWYPHDEDHRVIWVPPYIKGPPEKPLVMRDRVFSVSR